MAEKGISGAIMRFPWASVFRKSGATKAVHFMQSRILIAGAALFLAFLPSAHAQVTIDVSKITCDQFAHGKIGPTRSVGIWLSGFVNGRRDNKNVDVQTFQAGLSELERLCYDEKNFAVPVLQAIEQIDGRTR
jgi:hypothetical protein